MVDQDISRKKELERNEDTRMDKFQSLFNKHTFLLDHNNIFYDKVDIFFKDLVSCWTDDVLKEEVELFVREDVTRIFAHHSVRSYCRRHLETFCCFIGQVLDKCDLDILIDFIVNENIFYKTLICEREFHKHFLSLILPRLIEKLGKYDDPRLFKEVCEVFRKCILNRNSAEFDDYLNEVLKISERKSSEKPIIPKAVLKAVTAAYQLDNVEANIIHRIILQSLFNSFKDFSIIYKFVIVLIEILGFDLSRDFESHKISKYKNSNIELTKSLSILSDILKVIKNNKVDLSCTVKITFSQFVNNIVNSLFALTKSPNVNCYKILTFSIEIHPLLVEQNLNNLLVYSMLTNNADYSAEYASFLLKIFETYDKLHRIQNLISKMLPVLKSSINGNETYEEYYSFRGNNDCSNTKVRLHLDVEKALPENVLNYFTECVVLMASWQVMNLLKTFIFHLDSTVASFVDDTNEDGDHSFLNLLCKFSSWLLRSIRMAENTITSTVQEKFISGMNEFKNILSKLGGALLKQEHNDTLVGAFLNLSHDWAEIYMVFHYYNSNSIQDKEVFYNVNHPDYIHSFLTTKQWFLLSQRITNFGECNCKHLMLKLLVQRVRLIQLFGIEINENIEKEVLEHITSDLENDCQYLITEKFIKGKILDKIDSEIVIKMAEQILNNTTENIPFEVTDSKILCKALTYVIFSKMSNFLKSKSLFTKIFSNIDREWFLSETQDAEDHIIVLKNIYEKNLWENDGSSKIDLKEISTLLSWLRQLPIPHLNPRIQSTVILCLFSLHKAFWKDQNIELKDSVEIMITGLFRAVAADLMDIFEPISLVKNITLNFTRKDSLISLLSENILKNESFISRFIPGIHYLLENLKFDDNLHHSIVIYNDLQKVKKFKNSKEFKETCSELRDLIISKHFEIVTKKKVDMTLIQSYVCCLKHSLGQGNDKSVSKLVDLADSYLNAALESKSDILPSGCTSLFSAVLHNKQALNMSSDMPLIIWRCCKMKQAPPSDVQDFSLLMCLVFEHIPNEEFENVAHDLLNITEEPIEKKDFVLLSRHLNTWSYILTSSFNPIKSKIWQQILEKLVIKLHILKDQIDSNQKIYDEIMKFEVSIIQHNQLLLSPSLIGVFLMSPFLLLQKSNHEFYSKFHTCSDYLGYLLKHRNSLIMDRLPTFLRVFRLLLEALCDHCNKKDNEKEVSDLEKLADCAHQLEKLTRQLVLSKKDMARIAPHLIADILQQYEKATLFPKVKIHLNNCIYSLLSLCDQHSISFLLRVLSTASTEMFKVMFDNYKKFYRFTGKV